MYSINYCLEGAYRFPNSVGSQRFYKLTYAEMCRVIHHVQYNCTFNLHDVHTDFIFETDNLGFCSDLVSFWYCSYVLTWLKVDTINYRVLQCFGAYGI